MGKLLFAFVGSSVGGWAIFTAISIHNSQTTNSPQPAKLAAVSDRSTSQASDTKQPDTKPSDAAPQQGPNKVAVATDHGSLIATPSDAQGTYLLDGYPKEIKASLLETVRGTIDFLGPSEKTAPEQPAATQGSNSGNLFSLLEAASNSKSEPPGGYPSNSGYAETDSYQETNDSSSMSAEEAQREAIRQRFLEAIRASAARRQAEAEEQAQ